MSHQHKLIEECKTVARSLAMEAWEDGFKHIGGTPSPEGQLAWEQFNESVDRLGKLIEITEAQRDQARARYDRVIKILTGIHMLLDPDPITVEGKTYIFENPMAQEALRELSRRIRAIPDEINDI